MNWKHLKDNPPENGCGWIVAARIKADGKIVHARTMLYDGPDEIYEPDGHGFIWRSPEHFTDDTYYITLDEIK